MPYLKKAIKRKRPKVIKPKDDDRRFYNTSRWRKLREWKLSVNPVCEYCEKHGVTKLAEEIHHLTPISDGLTDDRKRTLAYDPLNLLSVCKPCHIQLHKILKKEYKKYRKLVLYFSSKNKNK